MKGRIVIRTEHYNLYLEIFLISAIVAVLAIRFYLKITDYPVIGGGLLHISHMLFGGIMMSAAMILLLTLLNPYTKRASAFIGGLGFGTFIDEVGKFITQDNNYFYKPTFAIIYTTFIILYLILHFMGRRREFSEEESLVHSIELLKESALHDLDLHEKHRALENLSRADQEDPLVDRLRRWFDSIDANTPKKPSFWRLVHSGSKNLIFSLIKRIWFKRIIITFFLSQAAVSLIIAVFYLMEKNTSILPALLLSHTLTVKSYNVFHLYTTLFSSAFIILGVYYISRSRILEAFVMFKRSILISILLGQVFAFYYNPIHAFTTLIFNVLLLGALTYIIEHEREIREMAFED